MIDYFQEFRRLLVPLLLMIASSCTWSTKTQRSTYEEDLSKHRQPFKTVTQDTSQDAQHWADQKQAPRGSLQAVTEQLDDLLVRRKLASKQIKRVSGYTIQVYAGGSREAAFKARNKLHTHYPTLQPEVKYVLPNYTVRVGKFIDKLEAYTVYAMLKKHMLQAIIRPISFPNTPQSKLIGH